MKFGWVVFLMLMTMNKDISVEYEITWRVIKLKKVKCENPSDMINTSLPFKNEKI